MKHYLFCAGGCGAKVLEAIVHLCAAGLGPGQTGASKIRILMIDSDVSGGNLERTNEVVNSYQNCFSDFGGKIGTEEFFKTELSLWAVPQGGGVAGAWTPVNPAQHFRDVLGYNNLNPQQKMVADLLFTPAERDMLMNEGFLAHPSLGAAALSLLPLYGSAAGAENAGRPQPDTPRAADQSCWQAIAGQINADLANDQVRVVIAGSVFGGTGASAFFPLARWLKAAAGVRASNLQIAAVAFAPYFSFRPADDQAAAVAAGNARLPTAPGPDSAKFPLATRAAAQFYHQMRQLGAWPFVAMYWLGDDAPVDVPRYSGGPNQRNPSHFVELLGAQAALDFFAGVNANNSCFYAGTAGDAQNTVEWLDIPRGPFDGSSPSKLNAQLKREILRFLSCCALHNGVYRELFEGGPRSAPIKTETIPWYYRYYLKKGLNLTTPPHSDRLSHFGEFSNRTIRWWAQLHSTTPERLRLLNPQAFEDLQQRNPSLESGRLTNLCYPDDVKSHGDGWTDFHNRTCAVGLPSGTKEPAPVYLALLARASASFVKEHYGLG